MNQADYLHAIRMRAAMRGWDMHEGDLAALIGALVFWPASVTNDTDKP